MSTTPGTMVSLTNSGGNGWLSETDLIRLKSMGWTVHTHPQLRNWVSHVSIDRSIESAKHRFQVITGQDPDARGCDCCGRPFRFYAVTDITDPYSDA